VCAAESVLDQKWLCGVGNCVSVMSSSSRGNTKVKINALTLFILL
jgi:hypothetical protein